VSLSLFVSFPQITKSQPIWFTFCTVVDIEDIVTSATFGDDRLIGLRVVRINFYHFPLARVPCV